MAVLAERDPATLSPIEAWLVNDVAPEDHDEALAQFQQQSSAAERETFKYAWTALWARPNQRLPEGEWDTWMVRAGRGYGKTRTGSEGVRRLVNEGRARQVTIIGPTAADARDVMIEGPESGLLAVHPPDFMPTYKSSNRTVEWPNGAIGHVRSAEEPDSIRGLNSELVWGDEPASWKSGKEAWDNAMLGNRLGRPHSILTGTPRPLVWLQELEKMAGTRLATGSTYENIGNLADQFIALVLARYEGTRLGAQELHARYLEDVEGAMWRLATIEASRFMRFDLANPWASLITGITEHSRAAMGLGPFTLKAGDSRRPWTTWVAVDPPGETAECGIAVGTAPTNGRAGADHAVILDDMSVAGAAEVWAAQVVAAFYKYGAAGVVVEKNQGGDMCRAVIHAQDANVPIEKITAVENKADRAEPVSALYAKGWVHHLMHLPLLETQMTTWVAAETNNKSPDRLDALVHLVTKLLKPLPIKGARAYVPR